MNSHCILTELIVSSYEKHNEHNTPMRVEIQCHNCGITLLANSSFCSEFEIG